MAKNNQPAFPEQVTGYDENGNLETRHVSGMTLRDYFAAEVLPIAYESCAKGFERSNWPSDWRDFAARSAYAMADAMLKAREA